MICVKKSILIVPTVVLIAVVACQIIVPCCAYVASDNINISDKRSITIGENSIKDNNSAISMSNVEDGSSTIGINNISFSNAKELVLKNNRALKNLKRSLTDYKQGYENSLAAADKIEDKDFLDAPNYYYRMFLYKTMELIPEQRKHALISAEDNIRAHKEQLITDLRNHYQILLAGNSSIEIQKMKYALDKKRHNINIIKYRNGLITELELEESEYNLLKSQMALSEVVRNYENTCRNFNLYIGAPIGIFYNEVEYEDLDDTPMYDIDFYYQEALCNRYEIQTIEGQIALKKLEMEILERNQVYKTYTRAKKEHENIEVEIKTLELDLEKTKLNIKKEIYSIFIDAANANEEIERAERKLRNLKRKLNLAKVRYNAGVLSELNVEQVEIEVHEAGNSIKNAIYNYNTKLMILYNASGLYAITD